jgi:NCS1 family nucleobase:cation symporter-1
MGEPKESTALTMPQGLTEDLAGSPFYNPDMAPITWTKRRWGMRDLAALWISMAACIPTYMLASGMIAGGMNWWQAVLTIFLGNCIVLIPMLLNAHAGTKYGIPFPVYCRASFGLLGANVPALLRALVACGWFGIQTWIGGQAIYEILTNLFPGLGWKAFETIPGLGINLPQLLCFLFFWAINIFIIYCGIESIRILLNIKAPLLILLGLALLAWAYGQAGGFGDMLSKESEFGTTAERKHRIAQAIAVQGLASPGVASPVVPQVAVTLTVAASQPSALGLKAGQFWPFFIIALTGNVAFWATLSLNIPDFTRYARSQRDQVIGQAVGLPLTMGLYSFIGVAVTSAALVIYQDLPATEKEQLWNPIFLLNQFKNPVVLIGALFALCLATLATNIAANVVSPANDFSNVWPRRISFRMGGLITGIIGILIQPWRLIANAQVYIDKWLVGYSLLLGAIGGVLIADYFIVRRTRLDLAGLYRRQGPYWYAGGFNPIALVSLLAGIAPCVPGFLRAVGVPGIAPFWEDLYGFAWFVSFGIAFVLYAVLMHLRRPALTGR